MKFTLDDKQIRKLQFTLYDKFKGINLYQEETALAIYDNKNDYLLRIFLASKKVEGCSPKTLSNYGLVISQFLYTLNKAVEDICTDDIRYYLVKYQHDREISNLSIDNMRRVFSSFFAWLFDEDHISNNPIKKIKKIKCEHRVKKPFAEEEIEVLRDSCKNKRNLAIVDLLISTGMRVGELVLLNTEDIDFINGQCIVFGKGSKERETYLNAKAKIHLQEYINTRTDSNKALFVSLKKPYNRLSISGIESMIRQLGKKSGVSRAYPHKFRRTAATTAINRGMPIEQVQALLGHRQIDTTLKYAIVNQRNVKNSHEKFLS